MKQESKYVKLLENHVEVQAKLIKELTDMLHLDDLQDDENMQLKRENTEIKKELNGFYKRALKG